VQRLALPRDFAARNCRCCPRQGGVWLCKLQSVCVWWGIRFWPTSASQVSIVAPSRLGLAQGTDINQQKIWRVSQGLLCDHYIFINPVWWNWIAWFPIPHVRCIFYTVFCIFVCMYFTTLMSNIQWSPDNQDQEKNLDSFVYCHCDRIIMALFYLLRSQ